jgi:hypothetical protein
MPTEMLNLTDGLHAQVFLWTADNRNANLTFSNLRLVIEGDASVGLPASVAEPHALLLVGLGLTSVWFTRRRTQR